jgi:hypothetical protein
LFIHTITRFLLSRRRKKNFRFFHIFTSSRLSTFQPLISHISESSRSFYQIRIKGISGEDYPKTPDRTPKLNYRLQMIHFEQYNEDFHILRFSPHLHIFSLSFIQIRIKTFARKYSLRTRDPLGILNFRNQMFHFKHKKIPGCCFFYVIFRHFRLQIHLTHFDLMISCLSYDQIRVERYFGRDFLELSFRQRSEQMIHFCLNMGI